MDEALLKQIGYMLDHPGSFGEVTAYMARLEAKNTKLVEALRLIDQANNGPWDGAEQKRYIEKAHTNARALLGELGA